MIKRLYHFAFRFKEAFLYTIIILTSFVALLAFFYPGDEGMEAYIGIYSESLLLVIAGEGVEAGGFLFWITLQISVYIYYILVVTAIRIGARIIPTTKEDGVELTVGANSLSSRRFFGENLISAILVLALAIIPSYFMLMISVANQEGNNSVILERLVTTYFFAFVVAIAYMSIATLVSVFFFRRDWGVKAGLFYLIYSFIIELVSGTVNDLLGGYLDTIQEKTGFDMSGVDIGNISLNHYVSPTGGLLLGEYDWVPVFVTLGISGVFFGIAFWKVKTREYIEVAPKAKNGRQINLFGPEGKLAQKYPLVFEQLRSDFGALIGWRIFNLAIVFMMPSLLPSEEDFASLMTGVDMPM